MPINAVSYEFLMSKLAGLVGSVNSITPDENQNVALTAFEIPYAHLVYDVTKTPAPPALPRARSWHVDFVVPVGEQGLMGSYDYRRYFYASAADSQEDNPSKAMAAWVIEGHHMFFEYYEEGATTIVDLTDADGLVLIDHYRPIYESSSRAVPPPHIKWFFGPNHGTSAFPDDDNARSIIDIDIDALNTIIGNSFDLSTVAKQLVPAINELYHLHRSQQQVLITDEETPNNLVGNPGDIAITPYGIYVMKFKVSTGFLAISTDARFAGIWTDMGVNEMHTISGASSHFVDIHGYVRNTNWYLHESGNYVLVWSNYNANPNTPRAGYWFFNNASTPRLDAGALLSLETPNSPQLPTSLPPSGSWGGGVSITWSNYTGSEPSGMGWVRHFKVNSLPSGELFVDTAPVPAIPMPPPTGNVTLRSNNGVLSWA